MEQNMFFETFYRLYGTQRNSKELKEINLLLASLQGWMSTVEMNSLLDAIVDRMNEIAD